jgi:hypothetical protein
MTDDALISTIALDEWLGLKARIRELEAENYRLNMEMAAYRQGCTPKDAAAMLAVKDALDAEKKARSTTSQLSECPVCRRPLDADEVYGSCANTKDGHHRRVRGSDAP